MTVDFWSLFGWWFFVGICEYLGLTLYAFVMFAVSERYFGLGGAIVVGYTVWCSIFILPIAWLCYGFYLIGTQF